MSEAEKSKCKKEIRKMQYEKTTIQLEKENAKGDQKNVCKY